VTLVCNDPDTDPDPDLTLTSNPSFTLNPTGTFIQVRSIEVAILMPGRSTTAWDWWSDAACGGGMAGAVLSHVTDALRFMLDACVPILLLENTGLRKPSPRD
jgi:hypothetical protein